MNNQKHSITSLNINTSTKTKLSSFGINNVEQIISWDLKEISSLPNFQKDEAYTLYLTLQQFLSGKPTQETPKELLCFEESAVTCTICNKQKFELVAFHYPEGLKKLAYDTINTNRYFPTTIYNQEKDILICLNCR